MIEKILDNLRPDLRIETKRFLVKLSDTELNGILTLSENVQPLEIESLMTEYYLKGKIKAEDVSGWDILNGILFDTLKEKFNSSH